jgi:hypothetical protein
MSQDNKVYYVPKGSPVYPNPFDTRIRLRSLTRGLLSEDEVKNYLDSLPDDSANAEFVDLNAILEGEDSARVDGDLIASATNGSSNNG